MLISAAFWNAIGLFVILAPVILAWFAFDLSQIPSRKVLASERLEREPGEILSVVE